MNSLNLTRLFDVSFTFFLIWLLSVKEIFIFNEELLILACFFIFSSFSFYSAKQMIVLELEVKVNQFKEVFDFYINQTKTMQKQKQIELVKNNNLQNEIKKLPSFFTGKIQNLQEIYTVFLNNLFIAYINEIYSRLLHLKKQQSIENQVLYLNLAIYRSLVLEFDKNNSKRFIQSF